jgi:hypothetical protein
MASCSCDGAPVGAMLAAGPDFAALARRCRHSFGQRSGRLQLGVPGWDDTRLRRTEDELNRLWQACGCAEGSAALLLTALAWALGWTPAQALGFDGTAAVLAGLAWLAAASWAAKTLAVWLAGLRLARRLDRLADELRACDAPSLQPG